MDAVAEIDRAEVKNNRDDLQDLFKQSFRFAQGSIDVQKSIISWFINEKYIEENDFDNVPSFVYQMRPPRIHTDINKGTNPDESYANPFEGAWKLISEKLKNEEKLSEKSLEKKILDDMLDQEEGYQRRGREGRESYNQKEVVPDSPQDKYGSVLRKYVLFENSSNSEAMDSLLSMLRERSRFLPMLLRNLATGWEKNHPGLSFFPDNFAEDRFK